jgi:hypothetical protein
VTGGFGWFTINTRYANDDGFEQDLVIEQVANPFAITPDPNSTGADSADWNLAFHADAMTKAAFEKRWDGADPVSFGEKGVGLTPVNDGELVFTVAMWQREQTTREIVALSPMDPQAIAGVDPDAAYQAMQLMGERMIVELSVYKANKDLFDACGVRPLGQSRKVPSHKVTQRILSGADVLETVEWAGKYIPIVPVYGEDLNIEGKRHLSGLVRPAKDPQRMFNYWRTWPPSSWPLRPRPRSSARSARSPPMPRSGPPTPTPTPTSSTTVPGGGARLASPSPAFRPAMQEALNASDDMKSIMGLHDASLGARSNETSGRRDHGPPARRRRLDSFHFIDNLSRAIRHAGRILHRPDPEGLLDARMIRILGPDGDKTQDRRGANGQHQTPGRRRVQESQQDEASTGTRAHLRPHRRQVRPDRLAGPSFTSRREEAATQMIELIRAYPPAAPLIGDLLAKNLDWPGADEIAKRLKAMLPAQIQGERRTPRRPR